MIQMRDDGGFGPGKSRGNGEEWSDFEFILQLKLTGIADG